MLCSVYQVAWDKRKQLGSQGRQNYPGSIVVTGDATSWKGEEESLRRQLSITVDNRAVFLGTPSQTKEEQPIIVFPARHFLHDTELVKEGN